jgi:aerobic C4-dicarboxylate transport protein
MRRFLGKLYVQVLIGVFAGVALGFFAPHLGSDLKPLGDVFIKLIKMVFAPIIFATVVLGIARMENMKELGRGRPCGRWSTSRCCRPSPWLSAWWW